MYEKVKLGFCPIGKVLFSHEDAKFYKAVIEKKMDGMGISYIGIEGAVPDGIIRSHKDVGPAVAFLKSKEVDCLFIPHCNFGTESAAGMIAKEMGLPVLLWGPQDMAPLKDGTRLRDSLCGLFASSKILVKLGVPFTYIENCRVEDLAFQDGMDRFIRVSNVVKRFKKARIGMVGNRIDFFWSTIVNESELLEKFGIEILPMDLIKTVRMTRERAKKDYLLYQKEIEQIRKDVEIDSLSPEGLVNVLALRDVLYDWAVENGLKAITVESFISITEELGAMVCYAQAALTEKGIPCVCESDIHGAISSILVEAAALNTVPSFFADLTIRHPENENGLLLWHDAFPLSLKAPDSRGRIGTHWIIPDINPGMCHWKLKDGQVSIVRFDGERGEYRLLAQQARSIPGPYTQNTYLWVEMDNWKKFERKVIEGPYIHHTACVYGDYIDVLREACKYIEGLIFDEIE